MLSCDWFAAAVTLQAFAPTFKFNACNRHSTPSLCIVIDVGYIFNVKCMILITLSLFIHSLIISSVYLSLYLYLYTDYYSVYRTFICIAHLPFQLLSFRNLCGDYKLEFMERKLWSVISVYWTGPTSQFWLVARTLFLTSYALSRSQNDTTSSIW